MKWFYECSDDKDLCKKREDLPCIARQVFLSSSELIDAIWDIVGQFEEKILEGDCVHSAAVKFFRKMNSISIIVNVFVAVEEANTYSFELFIT